MGFGLGYHFGFGIFSVLFILMFITFFVVFIIGLVIGIKKWNKNNHAPRLTVPVTVVSKRTNVSHHHHAGEHHMSTMDTTYYVTFQVESGDRMELHMTGQEYGLLVEGDRGRLTFQGTRYLGFERT